MLPTFPPSCREIVTASDGRLLAIAVTTAILGLLCTGWMLSIMPELLKAAPGG